MNVQHYIARENIERVIMNYRNLNVIEEKYAAVIMGTVDGVLGFTGRPAPEGKIIPFPGVTLAPEPEAPPPEPPRPDFSEIRERFEKQGLRKREIIHAVYNLGAYTPEQIAALPVNKIARRRGVGKKAIENLRAFLQSKGLDLKE